MFHLFWLLLNLLLFGLIIYLIYRLCIVIRVRFGVVAALLFLFLAVAFTMRPRPEKKGTSPEVVLTLDSSRQADAIIGSVEQVLEKNLLCSISLLILRGQERDTKRIVARHALSNLTGVSGGYAWVPQKLTVMNVGGRFKYEVTGVMQWRLVGLGQVYSEQKTFRGEAPIRRL